MKRIGQWLAAFISGSGLGFLVGLSQTPVVASVIGVVLALCVSLVTIGQTIRLSVDNASGDTDLPAWLKLFSGSKIMVGPTAFLVLGIAFGSWIGLTERKEQNMALAKFLLKSGVGTSELVKVLSDSDLATSLLFTLYARGGDEKPAAGLESLTSFVGFAEDTRSRPEAAGKALRLLGGKDLEVDCEAMHSSLRGKRESALEDLAAKVDGFGAFVAEFDEASGVQEALIEHLLCPPDSQLHLP